MEPKNKHNIFSKEEFFKLIDEKKSLPPDADDFDKEAMEGLAMVTDRKKLDTLDESIDEVLRREASKANRKKNMYYFAAAASLLLIVGFFFLVKENTVMKEDKNMAQSETVKTEDVVANEEKPAFAPAKEPATVVADEQPKTGEATGKAMGPAEQVSTKEVSDNAFAADVTTTSVPAAEVEGKITLAESNEKIVAGGGLDRADANLEDKKSGGKTGKDLVSTLDKEEELQKRETAKKADEKKIYKSKQEDDAKVRYETNTVWTSTGTTANKSAVDELKQQQTKTKTETKPGQVTDNRNQVTEVTVNNAAPVQTQTFDGDVAVGGEAENDKTKEDAPRKNAEIVSVSDKVSKGTFGKKSRSKKARKIKSTSFEGPATDDSEKAGYAYYSQSGTRGFTSPVFTGGDAELQKFIKGNLKISEPTKKGTITTEFTIKKDGNVDTSSVKITVPIKDCNPCSKDVKDMVKKMPKWQPALENGQGKEYRQKLSVPYNADK